MAEPEWTDNPFAPGGADPTPFNDPSVAQAEATMPEYDPFSGKESAASSATTTAAAKEPDWAVEQQGTPSPKKSKKQTKKEKAAAAKQTQDEAARQDQYDDLENQANAPQYKDPNFRPANWPPFAKKCIWPFKPCFHHDFKGEIPEWGYAATKHCYWIWLLYFVSLFWNMICNAVALGANDVSHADQSFGLSVAYFFILAPLAYTCWFQSLYQAMRKDSSLRFGWYFFTFAFQFMTGVFFSLGVPGTGASGIWVASDAIHEDSGVGIVMFTGAVLFLITTIYTGIHIKWVVSLYRSSGQSIQKAQKEAVQGAVAASVS
eukprot:m.263932 g.263932  ORF g.263932 m.263932 type:complete len:318 (-) comp19714_c0_seq1:1134-2087(-)